MTTASTKPYLMRAIWEWCVDQGFTPYIAVKVDEHTRVPPGFARDDQIVLNLSSDATGQLQMGNELITFQARFGGVAHSLAVPVDNVLAIYARENGQGMAFGQESDPFGDEDSSDDLFSDAADIDAQLADDAKQGEPVLEDARPDAGRGGARSADRHGSEPPQPPRGSHLKIVK